MKAKLIRGFPPVFFLAAGIVFFRNLTVDGGGDLRVYWRVAQRVLAGGPIYLPSTDIPMAFKYPPWCLPVFLPLGALPFEAARVIWALLSVLAMFSVFYWISRRLGCGHWSIVVPLAICWGIWGGQFNHGQVNVVVLAGLLWFWSPKLPSVASWKGTGLLFAASTKIFTAFPLLFFLKSIVNASDRPRWLRIGGGSALVFALLSIPALLSFDPPHFQNLIENWRAVAGSAVQGFGPEFARGRMNQGLPVLVGRSMGFTSLSDLPELIGFLLFAPAIAIAWIRASSVLRPEESWAGWVAWVCAIHPLGWSHNFVLALPLLSVSLDRAWKSGRTELKLLALLGIVATGMLTLNTWSGFVALEHLSIKSWGALLCGWVLVEARSGRQAFFRPTP